MQQKAYNVILDYTVVGPRAPEQIMDELKEDVIHAEAIGPSAIQFGYGTQARSKEQAVHIAATNLINKMSPVTALSVSALDVTAYGPNEADTARAPPA